MLSRLGRFIRGRFARDRGRGSQDDGVAERRTGTETPPAEGDPFAREVLRRVRPLSVSRAPARRSLAVSGRQPLIQAEAPRVRQDVPSAELPLVRSAHPGAAPEVEEGGEAPGGDTHFYEGSTGDARWDALWTMRGTSRTTPEAALPDREGPTTPAPRERPTPRRSQPAQRGPNAAPRSVQRTPSPAARATDLSGEAIGRVGAPPEERTPDEIQAEPLGRDLEATIGEMGEEEATPTRPLPRERVRPQAPAPGRATQAEPQQSQTGEGKRPAARTEEAASPWPIGERARAAGSAAAVPPQVQRRIVPRSTLEEMPTRREAPPRATGARPEPEPSPQASADAVPHATERQGPPSPIAPPPPAAVPVQRAIAPAARDGVPAGEIAPAARDGVPAGEIAPAAREGVPAEEIAPTDEVGPEAAPADRGPTVTRQAAPDRASERGRRRITQPPVPAQQTPLRGAAQPPESVSASPEVHAMPPAPVQRAAQETGGIAEADAREPPVAEAAEGGPPAVARRAVERSLDGRPISDQPLARQRPVEPPGPARGPDRQAAPEPRRAAAEETGRAQPPTGRGRPKALHGPARPAGRRGQAVQAQRAVPPAGELPVEGPPVSEQAVQESGTERPAVSVSVPAAEDTAPERPAASPLDARVTGRGAEAPAVRAVAAQVQRDADVHGAGDAEPDRRALLRQAMQPRLVPTVVQAAPADGAQATSTTAGTSGQEAAAAAPEAAEEPDVESLARDVYRILRRRLLVERERDLGTR